MQIGQRVRIGGYYLKAGFDYAGRTGTVVTNWSTGIYAKIPRSHIRLDEPLDGYPESSLGGHITIEDEHLICIDEHGEDSSYLATLTRALGV